MQLGNLVNSLGTEHWEIIAQYLAGRSPRACRERWKLFLHPGITNGPWSHEEDNLLIQLVNNYGPKWKKISVFFKGRSECNIKNRWRCHLMQMEFEPHVQPSSTNGNSKQQDSSKITVKSSKISQKIESFDSSFLDKEDQFQIFPLADIQTPILVPNAFSSAHTDAPSPSPSQINETSSQPASAILINSDPIEDIFNFHFNPNDLSLDEQLYPWQF